MLRISIHALLAESDADVVPVQHCREDFYPRSPCGERPLRWGCLPSQSAFLSTLSLRRATALVPHQQKCRDGFLSTLSLRRATRHQGVLHQRAADFYPRSPCGERQGTFRCAVHIGSISIHALLAESDPGPKVMTPERYYFYPRSPCGERPQKRALAQSEQKFLSTLSLRRATTIFAVRPYDAPIFLSTLSLRRATVATVGLNLVGQIFLSTLSLRRATVQRGPWPHQRRHFYPRSPCGERPSQCRTLARGIYGFLSTLSLRRATCSFCPANSQRGHFYPRSPCGERRLLVARLA